MDTDGFFFTEPFHFDSTWNSPPSAAAEFASDQSPDCLLLTSISDDKSMDPPYYANFESSLTYPTLSSPPSAHAFAIQDHVGKLSIASNSDDLSPPQSATHHYLGGHKDNANNSSHISLSPLFNPSHSLHLPINLTNTPPPPHVNPFPPHSLGECELMIPIDMKSRKRQSRPKGKKKKPMDDAYKMEDEPNAKRSRLLIKAENDANEETPKKPNCDPPPKDYIHVRARRGQATDSHSLAERVRREKISERMKVLEHLVPGCNKVTGKALMLDEIINYVQSLQRQVEFLSMKLATVNHNTRLDFNIDNNLFKKDMFQPSDDYPMAPLHPLDCTEIDGQLNYEFWTRSFEGN